MALTLEPTFAELITELGRVIRNPISNKNDILKLIERLERTPVARQAIKADAISVALTNVLTGCTHNAFGDVMIGQRYVHTKDLAEAVGVPTDRATLSKVGQAMKALGYERKRSGNRTTKYRLVMGRRS